MNYSSQYFMTTSRLGFRHWTTNDLPLALALWGDAEVTRFIGGPFSEEAVQKKLAAEIDSIARNKVQYWPLFLLANNEHVGCGGLRPYQPDEQIYELGFHLRPAYWGRGLAEEAGRVIIRFALDELGAKGLFAGHHPANAASRTVLEKLGFKFTHEEFYTPTGANHPSYLLMRRGRSTSP
jgi:[ribosomal protein S5]-alanine N-acetyltransferase